MAEIKFISENRDMLIEKIDFMQNKFTSLVSEITDELRDAVTMFSERINNKLKTIEGKFSVQQEELENLKKELKSKQFDESNFNNVSMIKNQSKQIVEKETKIKELENRIRLLEGNNKASIINPIISSSKHTTTNILHKNDNLNIENNIPLDKTNKINNNNMLTNPPDNIPVDTIEKEVEISKDIVKISKSRINKKKPIEIDVAEPNDDINSDIKSIVEDTTKSVRKIVKKPIKKQLEEENEFQSKLKKDEKDEKDEEERVQLENETIEIQRMAEEELRLTDKTEEHRIVEEDTELNNKSKISKKTSAKSVLSASSSGKKTIEQKLIKKKIGREIEPVVDDAKTTSKVVVKITEKEHVHVQKKENNPQVVFPDCPPNDEDLEILELNGADYYRDTTNNNVYQIINGDDCGVFLGIYDENTNIIISP